MSPAPRGSPGASRRRAGAAGGQRVSVAAEGVRSPLSASRIANVVRMALRAERVPDAAISVALVSTERISSLNAEHFGRRGPTDVISFGLAPDPAASVAGDIYIAPEVARANARAEGRGVREEVVRLVVHGVLHVLGHDHPEGDGRERSPMWQRQERLVAQAARSILA